MGSRDGSQLLQLCGQRCSDSRHSAKVGNRDGEKGIVEFFVFVYRDRGVSTSPPATVEYCDKGITLFLEFCYVFLVANKSASPSVIYDSYVAQLNGSHQQSSEVHQQHDVRNSQT